MKKIIIAYIPVLHAGYQKFLSEQKNVDALYVLGPEIIADFDHLRRKDIRALDPKIIQQSLESWGLSFPIQIADKALLSEINSPEYTIVIPQEDELVAISQQYLDSAKVQMHSVFLRYDRSQSVTPNDVLADTEITRDAFSQQIIADAKKMAEKSSDWWRQVAGVVVDDGKVILSAWNKHVPDEKMPYVNGDPRGNFHKNDHIEASTALHAEAGLIAQAAKQGISLEGKDMYVTTFPCPNCAKLVAYSGIARLYFLEGYASVDGESIMKSQDIEIIRVVSDES